MRIGLCTIYHFSRYLGGNERYAHELGLALIKLGHQVIYITGQKNVPPMPYPVIHFPLFHLQGKPIPGINWLTPRLPPLDLLHTAGSGLPLHLLARSSRLPSVHTFQASTHPQGFIRTTGAKLEYNLIQATYDHLIVTSPYYLKNLPFNFPPQKTSFIPLMLPHQFYNLKPKQPPRHRLLFIGNLDRHHYYKGLPTLFQTLKLLPSVYRLDLIDSGSVDSEYLKLTRHLKLENRVNFLGQVTDQKLVMSYAQSSVYLQPSISDSEGFGLTLLEAMSQRTPVISTTATAGASWLASKKVATLVPPNDPVALAQAITKICTHPPRSIISAAYRFAHSLTPSNIAQKTLTVYQSIL